MSCARWSTRGRRVAGGRHPSWLGEHAGWPFDLLCFGDADIRMQILLIILCKRNGNHYLGLELVFMTGGRAGAGVVHVLSWHKDGCAAVNIFSLCDVYVRCCAEGV